LNLLNESSTGLDQPGTADAGSRDIALDPKDYKDEFIKGFNLVKLIYGSGWKTKDDVKTAYGVVMGESSGKRTATNDNWAKGSKGIDWGLWQINDYWHKEVGGEKIDFSKSRIFDAIYNSKIANAMWKDPKNHGGSTQTPWGGWNVHPGSGVFPGGSDGYRRGVDEFDNNPNWWRQIVTLTGGSSSGNNNNGNNGGGLGVDGTSDSAVKFIKNQVGDSYVSGATGPDSWDCSNLTAAAWNYATGKQILTVPSHTQANQLTKRVSGLKDGKISGVMPGDVLYFAPNGIGVLPGHTSMYVGNGSVVQASSPQTGVILSPLNNEWNVGVGKFQWAGPPKGYAAGGFISGPGGPRSDQIPSMLSNGEYVVKASSVAKYGKGFMDQVNAGQFGMGGLATTAPRMVSPAKYAGGGFVGSMIAATPTFGVPQVDTINPSSMNANIANSYGGSNSSSVRNSSKVNIVINGAGGKSSNAIANKVISMINQANGRRNHSRSAG
jgi:hypothetical protein